MQEEVTSNFNPGAVILSAVYTTRTTN